MLAIEKIQVHIESVIFAHTDKDTYALIGEFILLMNAMTNEEV